MKRKLWYLALLLLTASPVNATLLSVDRTPELGNLLQAGDRFGTSVALSGDGKTLVVGAAQASSRGSRSGAAHVFNLTEDGSWQVDESFRSLEPQINAFDAYGLSVAVSHNGRVVAIGAPLHDGAEGNAGAVYIYSKNEDGVWNQAKLVSADSQRNDQFGTSVALDDSGAVLVVGAPQPNPLSGADTRGKVYVFNLSPQQAQPVRLAVLQARQGNNFDFFGFSVGVAVHEGRTTVAVGAPGYDTGGDFQANNQEGALYLFECSSVWGDTSCPTTLLPQAKHRLLVAGAELGVSVAVSADGSTVVAGARQDRVRIAGADLELGTLYVFERKSNWNSPKRLSAGCQSNQCPEQFGAAVAISEKGESILVGAPGTNSEQGAAYIFQRADEDIGWTDQDKEAAPVQSCLGTGRPPRFGQSVALRGSAMAVGAPGAERDTAAAGTVCVSNVAGLSLTAVPGERSVAPGNPIHITITLTNEAATTVSGIELSVRSPKDQVENARLTAGACDKDSLDPASAIIDSLDPGADAARKVCYIAKVKPDAAGRLELEVSAQFIPREEPPVDVSVNIAGVPEINLAPKVDLSISKRVNKSRAIRGEELTYTIKVKNEKGPSQASNVEVRDRFSEYSDIIDLQSVKWECQATQGAQCGRGSGDIRDTVVIPPGGTLTYKAYVATLTNTPKRDLINIASVHSSLCNTSEHRCAKAEAETVLPRADLRVLVPDNQKAVPGETTNLTFRVCNRGEDAVTGALIGGEIVELPGATLVCGEQESQGDLAVDLDPQACVACSLKILVPADRRSPVSVKGEVELPSGSGVIDHNLENNSVSETASMDPQSLLTFVPVSLTEPVIPGALQPRTYTFSLINYGPSDLLEADVEALFPLPFAAITWKCEAKDADGSCLPPAAGEGNLLSKIHLPVDSTVEYQVRVLADAAGVGSISAIVSVAPGQSEDQNARAKPTADINAVLKPVTDLAVTHTGPAVVVPGEPLPEPYKLTVTNTGPSVARDIQVTHDFQPDLNNVTWTCVATRGSCPPNGSDEVRKETATLQPGGSATFSARVRGRVDPTLRGQLVVDGQALASEGTLDPRPENNSQRVDTELKPEVRLDIPTHTAPPKVVPGSPLSVPFTFTVSNAGPSAALGARVTYEFDRELAVAWTCVPLKASDSCPARGQGEIEVDVSLGVGGSVTFKVNVTAGPALTGKIKGTAEVQAVEAPEDIIISTSVAPLEPVAELAITKVYEPDSNPAKPIYKITVVNAGPSDVVGVVVRDEPPGGFKENATWTCTALNGSCGCVAGAPCAAVANAEPACSDDEDEVDYLEDKISVQAGGRVVYTVPVNAIEGVLNRACVVYDPSVMIDPRPTNNVAEAESTPPEQ